MDHPLGQLHQIDDHFLVKLNQIFSLLLGLVQVDLPLSPFLAFLITKKIQGVDLFGLNQFTKIDCRRFIIFK